MTDRIRRSTRRHRQRRERARRAALTLAAALTVVAAVGPPIGRLQPSTADMSGAGAGLGASTTSEGSLAPPQDPARPPPPETVQRAPDPVREAERSAASTAAVGAPVRVIVPAIDVDVDVVPVGLEPDGALAVPDFGLVGWYDLGPRPGEAGPAVLAGHVDSRSGPDVFYRLHELGAGDEIVVVDRDAVERRFTVQSSEQAPKDSLPVERIWNEVDAPGLRLITCGGDFDHSRRSYLDNIIVYATSTPTSAA